MAEESAAAGRVQQLEQQLATLQAKLQKSDTVKKKLREHLALLKEKAINSLALVEEQALLQQEHAKLQQQYADASAAVSQLQQAVQDAEAAKQAAEEQYHAVLQDLKTTEGKLRSAEKNISSTLRASMKAKQAVKERDEALAGMKAMQQQIQQLQLAVQQLQRVQPGQQQQQPAVQGEQQQQQQQQHKPHTVTMAQQQQLVQKVKQLESWVQGLQDIDIEIDANDMYSQLQRSVIDVLNAKIDSRLDGLQQRLAELQQQQKAAEASPAVAASTAAAAAFRSPLDRPATQRDVQQLQQQMEALAAQQQHWHALLQRMFADRTAAATGGMQGLHQDESFCMLPAVASAGPTREASPAVAAAFGHSNGAVASSSEAAATAVASGVATAQNAAAAAAPASAATWARGSSMFGTTALVVGGTSSSYGDGRTDTADRMLQAGSPSVGTATPRHSAQQQRQQQQQQQRGRLIGEKRQRDAEQEQQQEGDDDDDEDELDPWDAFLESNDMQLQLPDAAPLEQQQPQQRPQGGTECGTGEGPSKRARATAAAPAASDAAATLTSLHACGSIEQGQYADQRQQQQQELMEQLQTVRVQPEAAADVAQQLANAFEAGRFSEQVLLDSFSACFLLGAASEYNACELKHTLATLQREQCFQTRLLQPPSAGSGGTCSNQLQWQQQQQQQLQLLCTAGWVASSGAGASALPSVYGAQQNLAECACKLSVALEQQHWEQQQPCQQQQEQEEQQEYQQARRQQPCAAECIIQQSSIWHAQEPCHWPALAECWRADQTVPGCSCGSAAQQHSSGISQLNSCGGRLGGIHKLACYVMAPVYKSVSQLGASVFGEHQQQRAKQALQQQQRGVDEQQQQQQQVVHEPNVAQACAAAAAAAQLYKAAGDQHRFLQLIARLLSMAAAYNWSNPTSSSHTGSYQDSSAASVITAGSVSVATHTDATSQAVAAVAAAKEGAAAAAAAAGGAGGESDRGGCDLQAGSATAAAARQCSRLGIACLLAAAGAWPAALQVDTAAADAAQMDGGVPTMPNKAHCMLCSSKQSAAVVERAAGSNSCMFWRWLVLHPALVAVRCCLQHLCDTAAATAVAADSLEVTAPALCNDSTVVQQLAAALQLLLRLAATGQGATRPGAAENAKEHRDVAGAAGDVCVAVGSLAAAVCLPAPGELLACLLGILKQLLQKQPAALPPGRQLPPFQGACEAALATFCAAASVVALFVQQQKVTALLKELRGSLGGDVSEWPVHVQRLLSV